VCERERERERESIAERHASAQAREEWKGAERRRRALGSRGE
jgi:hypothetical protein